MDLRIEKTVHAIKSAFIELRAKKPLEKMTVMELCRCACINKSTFYAHYQDIYDLADALEEELVQAILSGISWEQDAGAEHMEGLIQALCLSFLSNISLISILFSQKGQSRLGNRLEVGIKEKLFEKYPHYRNDVEKSILFSCLIQGAYHAYLNHQGEDPETIIRVLSEVARAVRALY